MRQHFGVVMERIVCELRGISCIPLEAMPPAKKQIMTSRSFGEKLTEFAEQRLPILPRVPGKSVVVSNWPRKP